MQLQSHSESPYHLKADTYHFLIVISARLTFGPVVLVQSSTLELSQAVLCSSMRDNVFLATAGNDQF